jgi:uncharacterized protein
MRSHSARSLLLDSGKTARRKSSRASSSWTSLARPLNVPDLLPSRAQEPQTMSKQIFVNLPVKDLQRSVTFFTALGYTFNPQFTDENATCMIIGENIYAMLLVEPFFKTFTPKPIADAKASTEVLIALSQGSREAVNEIVEAALKAGAKRYAEPKDHGFMFQWGFEDLDGHIWEHMWMDPSYVQG